MHHTQTVGYVVLGCVALVTLAAIIAIVPGDITGRVTFSGRLSNWLGWQGAPSGGSENDNGLQGDVCDEVGTYACGDYITKENAPGCTISPCPQVTTNNGPRLLLECMDTAAGSGQATLSQRILDRIKRMFPGFDTTSPRYRTIGWCPEETTCTENPPDCRDAEGNLHPPTWRSTPPPATNEGSACKTNGVSCTGYAECCSHVCADGSCVGGGNTGGGNTGGGNTGGNTGGSSFKSCNSIPRAFCSNDGAPGATQISEYDGKDVTCGSCTISPCPPGGPAGSCWLCPADRPKYNGIDHTCIPEDERVVPRCERTAGQRCIIGDPDLTTMSYVTGSTEQRSCAPWDGINMHSGSLVWLQNGCARCNDGYHWEPAAWSPRVGHAEDYYVGGNQPAMACVPD